MKINWDRGIWTAYVTIYTIMNDDYNKNLANMVWDLQKTNTPLSTRFTWVQEPIRFENAIGNVIPVVSESDWEVSHPA